MASRLRFAAAISVSLVFVGFLVASPETSAHPPWNPYDDTRFAPITSFGPNIGIEVVADGMTAPNKAVHAPGQPNTLYVTDQPGTLWRVDLTNPNRATNKTVFLDVRDKIGPLGVCGAGSFDERGLLGVAFHPDYYKNGKFYTYISEMQTAGAPTFPGSPTGANPDHDNVVREWQVALPVTAASRPVSNRELMRVIWPQFNHDGGDLAFGPDGNLYISMGDGGSADDADGEPFVLALPRYPQTPNCTLGAASSGHQFDGNGQKLNTPLGKILRIDVDCDPRVKGSCNSTNGQYRLPRDNPFVIQPRPGALGEIYAYGFRNPFRMSFDMKRAGHSRRADLYVGDVGQNDIEEVDVVENGGNYGWNCKEGTKWFHINGAAPGTADDERDSSRPDCNPYRKGFRDPLAEYDTHHEGHSVIGGHVYHGSLVPALRGKYVFADFSLLFKFPRGPHDYGRVFVLDADEKDRDRRHGRRGLSRISEMMVLPGGAVSFALLGMGQDAHGEVYLTGNVSGLPFPDLQPQGTGQESPPLPRLEVLNGRVLRIVPAPKPADDD